MADKQRITESSDEIDLFTIIEGGISFVRRFGILILVFSVVGLALGLAQYSITPKKYTSRLILRSGVLTNEEDIEIIASWKELMKRGQTPALAQILDMDVSAVRKLSDISAEQVQKMYAGNNPNGFMVDVLITDTTILRELQAGIIHGLENSEFVKEKVATKRATYTELIQNVKTEIVRLDSTRAIVEKMLANPSRYSSSMLIDVSGMNAQSIDLNEKLHTYQNELRFVNAVEVLQNFNTINKAEEPKLYKSVVFGIVAGAFTGYIISLIIYIRRKLKARATARSIVP
jgi:hypothetical protein